MAQDLIEPFAALKVKGDEGSSAMSLSSFFFGNI